MYVRVSYVISLCYCRFSAFIQYIMNKKGAVFCVNERYNVRRKRVFRACLYVISNNYAFTLRSVVCIPLSFSFSHSLARLTSELCLPDSCRSCAVILWNEPHIAK